MFVAQICLPIIIIIIVKSMCLPFESVLNDNNKSIYDQFIEIGATSKCLMRNQSLYYINIVINPFLVRTAIWLS